MLVYFVVSVCQIQLAVQLVVVSFLADGKPFRRMQSIIEL